VLTVETIIFNLVRNTQLHIAFRTSWCPYTL